MLPSEIWQPEAIRCGDLKEKLENERREDGKSDTCEAKGYCY